MAIHMGLPHFFFNGLIAFYYVDFSQFVLSSIGRFFSSSFSLFETVRQGTFFCIYLFTLAQYFCTTDSQK